MCSCLVQEASSVCDHGYRSLTQWLMFAVVLLSAYFGRLPVVFWFLLVSMATAACCAGATSFDSFMAARILNGFFSTVTQAGGLMFIQDIFFFHERARKINIWS